MGEYEKAIRRTIRASAALGRAVQSLAKVHEAPLTIFVAAGTPVIVDDKRHEASDEVMRGGYDYDRGGAIVVHLDTGGAHWDGGDF